MCWVGPYTKDMTISQTDSLREFLLIETMDDWCRITISSLLVGVVIGDRRKDSSENK